MIDASPSVVNGVVYIGSVDDTLYALNANTGVELWHYAIQSHVDSSPAVANGILYIGSFDGALFAINT